MRPSYVWYFIGPPPRFLVIEIAFFILQECNIQYKDIVACSKLTEAYWCKSFFEENFCGKQRLSFIKNNKFSIELNKDNNKVINVIAIGENPLYKVTSKYYMSFGDTKNHFRWRSHGLNFISIDGEWQIY